MLVTLCEAIGPYSALSQMTRDSCVREGLRRVVKAWHQSCTVVSTRPNPLIKRIKALLATRDERPAQPQSRLQTHSDIWKDATVLKCVCSPSSGEGLCSWPGLCSHFISRALSWNDGFALHFRLFSQKAGAELALFHPDWVLWGWVLAPGKLVGGHISPC